MAQVNINRVVVSGNLTRDPELRQTNGATAVCELRIAVNSSRKDSSGEWVDKPNYFNVKVWGAQGESCATYLSKGRPVAVDGRLDWREWEARDGSGKRQAVDIVAERVQFVGGPRGEDERREREPAAVGGALEGRDDDDEFPF
ncbi:MAG: single-stranded DNA-binding protein [Solirubrobacterales bacterium]|nr:single-stranded DNA-binding protein [Solirubrobacterales bacterium]